MNCLKFTLLFSLLFIGITDKERTLLAQEFANPSYYLVDSLVLEQLSSFDEALLDSCLAIYHSSESDTIKIRAITAIVEESWDDNVWPVYNQWIYTLAKQKLLLGTKYERNYKIALANATNNKGVVSYGQGELADALEYYKQSSALFLELNDNKNTALILINIGGLYETQGDIKRCLDYYHESLVMLEKIGEKKGIAVCLNNIGATYEDQGEQEKALSFYKRSLAIQTEIENKQGMSLCFNNIGMVYKKRGEYEKALGFFFQSLKIRESIGNKSGIALSLSNIGNACFLQGKENDALEFFQRSLEISRENGFKRTIALNLANIGEVYFKKNDLLSAKSHVEQSLQISQEIRNIKQIIHSAKLLYLITKREASFQEAITMYELYIQMRDSIKNEETQKATIRQQTKYEFEKAQLVHEQEEKEKIRLLEETNSRRNNLQYSFIFLAILIVFGGVLGLGFVKVSPIIAEGLIFFAFLIWFEFLLVLSDPYIDVWTGGEPIYKLLLNAILAALIFPLHAFFEKTLKKRLVK